MNKISSYCFLTALSFFSWVHGCDHAQKVHDIVTSNPNPSDRFGTKDRTNVFLNADFVYLKPLTEELAQETRSTTNGYQIITDTNFQNQFAPGFRVALGYNPNYDGWDLSLGYFGYYNDHSNSYVRLTDTDGEINIHVKGTIKYRYDINQGDLDLGRQFKISKRLSLRPHAGIRGISLVQSGKYKASSLLSNSFYDVSLKFDGTLIGVVMGVDGFWKLSDCFSVYTNLALAELSNSQNIKYHYIAIDNDEKLTYKKNSRLVSEIDMSIGLRYDTNFSCDSYHVGLNVGYEQHSFLNINTWQGTHMSENSNALLNDSDLTLSGLTVGVRLDF